MNPWVRIACRLTVVCLFHLRIVKPYGRAEA